MTYDANFYNRLPTGTYEYQNAPQPVSEDAHYARKLAIQEGRLIVITDSPLSAADADAVESETECPGCACKKATYEWSDRPGVTNPFPANGTLPIPPGPTVSFVGTVPDGSKRMTLKLESVKVTPIDGECEKVEENCQEKTACSFKIELRFGSSMLGNGVIHPNVTFSNPAASTPGTIVVPPTQQVPRSAKVTTCAFELTLPADTALLTCGGLFPTDVILSLAQLNPTLAGWTFTDATSPAIALIISLQCEECD